jgi:hypothetical protein
VEQHFERHDGEVYVGEIPLVGMKEEVELRLTVGHKPLYMRMKLNADTFPEVETQPHLFLDILHHL